MYAIPPDALAMFACMSLALVLAVWALTKGARRLETEASLQRWDPRVPSTWEAPDGTRIVVRPCSPPGLHAIRCSGADVTVERLLSIGAVRSEARFGGWVLLAPHASCATPLPA